MAATGFDLPTLALYVPEFTRELCAHMGDVRPLGQVNATLRAEVKRAERCAVADKLGVPLGRMPSDAWLEGRSFASFGEVAHTLATAKAWPLSLSRKMDVVDLLRRTQVPAERWSAYFPPQQFAVHFRGRQAGGWARLAKASSRHPVAPEALRILQGAGAPAAGAAAWMLRLVRQLLMRAHPELLRPPSPNPRGVGGIGAIGGRPVSRMQALLWFIASIRPPSVPFVSAMGCRQGLVVGCLVSVYLGLTSVRAPILGHVAISVAFLLMAVSTFAGAVDASFCLMWQSCIVLWLLLRALCSLFGFFTQASADETCVVAAKARLGLQAAPPSPTAIEVTSLLDRFWQRQQVEFRRHGVAVDGDKLWRNDPVFARLAADFEDEILQQWLRARGEQARRLAAEGLPHVCATQDERMSFTFRAPVEEDLWALELTRPIMNGERIRADAWCGAAGVRKMLSTRRMQEVRKKAIGIGAWAVVELLEDARYLAFWPAALR